jgi:hypothetical protein
MNISTCFRYASIPQPDGEIAAIILECESKMAAISLFTRLHGYLVAPSGHKRAEIHFSTNNNVLGSMYLKIEFEDQELVTVITGLEWAYVERLQESLEKFAYFLILAGYSEGGEFCILPPKDYHFYKGDVLINNKHIHGKNIEVVDWDTIVNSL